MVPELFEALKKRDQNRIGELSDEINLLENEADEIKTKYRASMPSTFMMPVDRRDLLMLISEQDRIADKANAIGRVLTYRKMVVPDPLVSLLGELMAQTIDSFAQAENVVEQLDELAPPGDRVGDVPRAAVLAIHIADQDLGVDAPGRLRCRRAAGQDGLVEPPGADDLSGNRFS